MKQPNYRELYAMAREQAPSSFEADQLFSHVTGWAPHSLPQTGGQPVPGKQRELLAALLARRAAGEPLQYLLGEWEFYGLPFTVGEGVLIPRADTELLVDAAIKIASRTGAANILDLCSGCGAIAVALAHHLPKAAVTAVELSAEAFAFLGKNIARNNVRATAVCADVHEYIPPAPVDIITANPPYIPSGDFEALQTEVRREPRMALDGGGDGLDFYRAITARYKRYLSGNGALCLEIGQGQTASVLMLLAQHGYRDMETLRDLGGNTRVVIGYR